MIAISYLRGTLAMLLTCGLLFSGSAVQAQPVDFEKLAADAKSSDEDTRIKAIQNLAAHGAEAVPTLVELLKAESAVTRAFAARALGKIGPAAKGAAEGLIEALGDPQPAVRRRAIEALGAIRPGPKVTVPLFAKLMEDADPGVRMHVMHAVAEAKGEAAPALIEALKNEKAAYWACVILREIGPDAKAAVPALCEKLQDTNPEVRREAALALAAIGSHDAVDKLVPLLKDEHGRIAATYALAVLGKVPPEADATIKANIKSDDPTLSATSMWALAKLHPEDTKLKAAVLSHLIGVLKSSDPFARTVAARALASLPASPEIAGPIFEKALANADEQTTHYLLDALAGLGAPAVPRLIPALKHPGLRGQVAAILGRIGPPAAPATDALAKLLSDPDLNVSTEAAHALAQIGPGAKAAVPALIEVLNKPEGKPVHAAVFALGKIGPASKPADQALLAILKKTDDSLSLLSAWALVKIHGSTAKSAGVVMPDLMAGLASSLVQSRQMACETLGELGPFAKSAAPALEKATKDRDPNVSKAATAALAAVKK